MTPSVDNDDRGESSVIAFLVPRRKVRLTHTARVPCSNAANRKTQDYRTQCELCNWQNSVRGQEPPKMYIYNVPAQQTAKGYRTHVASNCSFESSGLALTASHLNAYFADISTDPYYCRDALDDNLRSFGNSDLSAFVPFSADFFITVLGRIRSTSPDPEGIPSRICAVKLGPVIAKLVNLTV